MIDLQEWMKSQCNRLEEVISTTHIYDTLVSHNSVRYLSTPITTGPVFNEWYIKTGQNLKQTDAVLYKKEHYDNVIKINADISAQLGGAFKRDSSNKPIIEPTRFFMPHWTQEDYLAFWGEVIKTFVYKLYMREGWSYSCGCCFEFVTAMQNNKQVYSAETRIEIPLEKGIELIKESILNMKAMNIDTDFHYKMLEYLESN